MYVHERFLPTFRKFMGILEVNDDDYMSCDSGIDRPRLNDKKIQDIFPTIGGIIDTHNDGLKKLSRKKSDIDGY